MSCLLSLRDAKGTWKLQEPPDEASDPSVLTGQNQRTSSGSVKRSPTSRTDFKAADWADNRGRAARDLSHEGREEAADWGKHHDVAHQPGR